MSSRAVKPPMPPHDRETLSDLERQVGKPHILYTISKPAGRPKKNTNPNDISARRSTWAGDDQTWQKLVDLVRTYGRDGVKAAFNRPAGRPAKGAIRDYEAAHYADWIRDRENEYREAGKQSPVKLAIADALEIEQPFRKKERDAGAYHSTAKRRLTVGRAKLAEFEKSAEERRKLMNAGEKPRIASRIRKHLPGRKKYPRN